MPKVLNKNRDGIPDGAVYVGRPTQWGNPFVIGRDGNRHEVVRKYRNLCYDLIKYEDFNKQLAELKGKDLVCWCAPEECHAEILLELANADR